MVLKIILSISKFLLLNHSEKFQVAEENIEIISIWLDNIHKFMLDLGNYYFAFKAFVFPPYPKHHSLCATMYGSLPFFPSSLLLWVWPHSVFWHTSGLTSCNNLMLNSKNWMLFRMCWRENMHEDLFCWKILFCFKWLYLFLHSKIFFVLLMFKTEIIVLLGCMMIKLFDFRCLIVIIKFNYECLLVCLVVARVRSLQNKCNQ